MLRVAPVRSYIALLIFAIVCMLYGASQTQGALLGIDFGSEFIKVASVKPGTPFHIVVDEQSKRKIPAVVSFDNGERQFGNGAVQLAMRKPKETYMWAHRLLGKDINSPQVDELRRAGFPWEIVEIPGRGTLGFKHGSVVDEVSGESRDVIFSVEEVIAMSLQHVMKIGEADAEGPVKDCVITVPPYWTHRERQAMVNAAEIAGFNVLSLLNENTAAAIQYGIDRKYAENETHSILIYNMGSTSTKVNLAYYSAYVKKDRPLSKTNKTIGQFEMKALGYDETLGGNAFEMRLVDFIANNVNKQLESKKIKHDIYKNPRAMAKIRSAAEKAKIVLSANQDTPIFLNSLYEDTDFKMTVTRDEFYEMCSDLLDRVTGPIEQVLTDSGVSMESIDAVVIIGGGVRIPAVQTKIKQFLKRDHLAQNLNGDEAAVMGAVFRAANLSTTFQVRPLGMLDFTPYAVGVKIANVHDGEVPAAANQAANDEDSEEKEESDSSSSNKAFSKRASLFRRNSRLQKRKTVQFSHTSDFTCALSHELSKANALPRGISLPIDVYNVTGVKRLVENPKYSELLSSQKPRISLSFAVDSSGLVQLAKAEATLDEMVKVYRPKPKVNNTATVNATANANATDSDAAADKKDEKSEEAAAEKKDEKKDESEDKKVEEPEFDMKKKTHTFALKISHVGSPGSVESMNATHKLFAKSLLEKLRRADDLKKEIAAAKNAVEAHIYAVRASIEDEDVAKVSTDEQREAVRQSLSAAEEWLYEQGDDSAKVFNDKMAELKSLSAPIFFRLAELTALPQALNTTNSLIEHVTKQIEDYRKNRPWVKASELDALQSKLTDLKDWIADKQELQEKKKAWEEPAYNSEQLIDRARPIHKQSVDISKLKKPIEKPKPKRVPKTNTTANANNTKNNQTNVEEDTDANNSEQSDATNDDQSESESKSSEQSQSSGEPSEDDPPKDEL